MASWLLLLNLWSHDDPAGDDSILTFVVTLALAPVMMPVLLWIALRDGGIDRLMATWWVTLAIALAVLLGLSTGWLWAAAASAVGSVICLFWIGIRAWRDVRTQERAYRREDTFYR